MFVDDEDWRVREEVAKQGYGLERLIDDDEDWRVRRAVAEQGYGLEKLIKDEIQYVREMAEQKALAILREHTEQYYK